MKKIVLICLLFWLSQSLLRAQQQDIAEYEFTMDVMVKGSGHDAESGSRMDVHAQYEDGTSSLIWSQRLSGLNEGEMWYFKKTLIIKSNKKILRLVVYGERHWCNVLNCNPNSNGWITYGDINYTCNTQTFYGVPAYDGSSYFTVTTKPLSNVGVIDWSTDEKVSAAFRPDISFLTYHVGDKKFTSAPLMLSAKVYYEDGTFREIMPPVESRAKQDYGIDGDQHAGINITEVDKKISKVSFRTQCYFKKLMKITKSQTIPVSYNYDWDIFYIDSTRTFDVPPYTDNFDETFYDISPVLDGNSSIRINYTQPIIPITAGPENVLTATDTTYLKTVKGFVPDVYNWEYTVGTSDVWMRLPNQYQYKDSISLTATDIFGANTSDLLGQNIHFRVNFGCGDAERRSEIATLPILIASPHILSIDTIPNRCYQENNGSIKIHFDRQLYTGESLIIYDSLHVPGYETRSQIITSLESDSSFTWPAELEPGTHTVSLQGAYPNTPPILPTYTGGPSHTKIYSFTGPAPLTLTATPAVTPVNCNGGSDGTISLQASGGIGTKTAGYWLNGSADTTWQSFSAANTHTINALPAGGYRLRIKDANGCLVKDNSSNEIIPSAQIIQPTEALAIDNKSVINPLAFGASNGSAQAIIVGGTPLTSGGYTVQWTKDGTALTPVNTLNPFATALSGIGDGQYILTVTDKNYAATTGTNNQKGCMVKDTLTVLQPPLLTVTINEPHYISCYGYSDGVLEAHAQGGIQMPSVKYQYQWQKQIGGVWANIGQTDSTATGLKTGLYKIIVTDFNGITKDTTYLLAQPDTLILSLSSTEVSACLNNNGTATAAATGGTTPYAIEWSNGSSNTFTVTGLAKGKYLAYVTDTRGCKAEGQVQLHAPDPIKMVDSVVIPVTCYGGNNGAISYTLNGGTPPFAYQWSNGSTQQNVSGLTAGDYQLTVTDVTGCSKTFDFHISQPLQITINLGPDKTLCSGQTWLADATIAGSATYAWTSDNGFTANTPQATLSNAGTYSVTATNSQGCTATASLRIQRSNATIAATFTGSTQSLTNEEVVFVNISNPAPERIEWILPQTGGVQVLGKNEQYASLRFADTGYYTITMKAGVGACEKQVSQDITIIKNTRLDDPGAAQDPFIRQFYIAPNPNNGQFKAVISLRDPAQINLSLLNVSVGKLISQRRESGQANYEIPYNISLTAGTYVLLLETPKGNMTVKIVIL